MCFLLKNYSLVESVYLFIRYNKTKFFLRNTNDTGRNGVHKRNTHTKHLEKDAREASNDVNTFLILRFIKKQKPVVFRENIIC